MHYVFIFAQSFISLNIFVSYLSSNVIAQVLRNSYSDIYREDRRTRIFPSHLYERYPNRNLDQNNFLPGLYPATGDSRCLSDTNPYDPTVNTVKVNLLLGTVIGVNVSLCDGPGVVEYDRPNYRLNFSPKQYASLAVFLGIPYAVPPIKERRFKPPQVYPSFNSISALQYKNPCPQPEKYTGPKAGIDVSNEDCLYLNIFTPSVQRQYEKYPVMVYIHGGNWDHGSVNTFPAHMLAASQNVTVVTFNYRLGPLGFYANGEHTSAGNYGLLDQAMAIEWVYDNIAEFNGDFEKITLFGPGAGAASAGILALSSRLGKKIRRVIAQSGSAVADWAVSYDNYTIFNSSVEYATLFNCQYQSSWRTVDCLSRVSLVELETTPFKPKVGWLPWSPVVDYCTREENKKILPDVPENLIKSHYENLHPDFAYMTGVTRDEAATMLLEDPDFKASKYRVTKEMFEKKILEFSKILNFTLDVPALTKALEFMYLPRPKDINNKTLLKEGYINMLSDSYFKAPCDKMVKLLLQKHVKTYMYVLNSSLDGLQSIRDNDYNMLGNVVPHDIEFYMITGAPFMDPKLYPEKMSLNQARWTEADRNLSEFMMTAYANFAKFGDPTPEFSIMGKKKLLFNILWKPTTLKEMEYLSINTTNFTSVMMSKYRQTESKFWNEYIHSLEKREEASPTYCRPVFEHWEDQKHRYEASLWGVLGAILLFLLLSILCCCLYCRAKSKHVVSSEDIPDAISVTPSSIDTLLNMKRVDGGNRYFSERLCNEQKHTQV